MSHATQLHHRGSLADSMEIMNASALPGNGDDAVYGQVQERVVSSVKWTLEEALEEEVRGSLGSERYERRLVPQRPEATRSGTSRRELWTQSGLLLDVRVPKLRRGNRDLTWQSIARDERCWGPFLEQQLLHYPLGHRLRDLPEALHLPLGEVLSLEACNRLVWGRQKRAEAFTAARLERPPPIVVMEGLWRKLAGPTGDIKQDSVGRKRPGKHKEKRGMLTALGLWADGHGEMLTWHRAPGEEAPAGGELLEALYRQGGTEETTQLIVSDGAQGLEKALYSHLWDVPHPRGLFHKIKNLADHLQYTALVSQDPEVSSGPSRQAKQDDRQASLADASQMYATDVEAEIRAHAQAFQDTWQEREPKAVQIVLNDFARTFS